MRAPRSLRARIVLAALAGLFLSVVVTNTLLLAAVERDGRRTVDDELRERAERVVGPPGRSGRPGRGGFGGRGSGREGREPLLAGSGAFVQVAAAASSSSAATCPRMRPAFQSATVTPPSTSGARPGAR